MGEKMVNEDRGYVDFGEKVNCAVCNSALMKEELKFLLSSIELLEFDLPLEKRQVCVDCYSTMNSDIVRIKRYRQKFNIYKKLEAFNERDL